MVNEFIQIKAILIGMNWESNWIKDLNLAKREDGSEVQLRNWVEFSAIESGKGASSEADVLKYDQQMWNLFSIEACAELKSTEVAAQSKAVTESS
jgi:hypothetical protein